MINKICKFNNHNNSNYNKIMKILRNNKLKNKKLIMKINKFKN